MQTKEFSFSELIDACSSQPDKNKKFEIPKFQRKRAWKPEQEDELIETLKTGNISIGVLQLWKINGAGKMERYLLVDGLHRVSTIGKYYENPFGFNRTKKLINELITSMTEKYGKTYSSDVISKCCNEWLNKDILGNYQEFVEDKLFNDEIDKLKEIVGTHIVDKKGKEEFYKTLLEKTRGLVKNVDISESKIPAILNSGDYKDLTILFKRINQNGTPLSLCDVLAAVWSNTKMAIKNKEIVECISEYYAEMKQENNNMDIYEDGDNKLFTVYEYVTGLKRWLGKKFSGTFLGYIKDKEFLFKVLSCCEFEDITKKSIENLNTTLLEANLSNLEKDLVWSVEYISETFDDILIKEGKLLVTEVPIYVSLITLAYKNRAHIEKNKDKYSLLFVLNMLNDKISGVTFNGKTVDAVVKQKKYMYRVHKGEFVEKLNNYASDTIKLFGKYDKVTQLTKLILSVITKTMKDEDEDENDDMRFGNIIAKKVILDYNKEKKSRLSVNSLGNMCLFPVGENNRKPTQSIFNYMTGEKHSTKFIDEHITFLNGEDKFDDMLTKSDEFAKKEYLEFLKFRGTNIKNLLVEHFKDYLKSDDDDEEEEDNLDTETADDEENDNDGGKNDNDELDSSSDEDEVKPKKIVKKQIGNKKNKQEEEDSNSEESDDESTESNSENESDSDNESIESEEDVKPKKVEKNKSSKSKDDSDDNSKKPKKVEKKQVGNVTSIKIKSR